MADKPADSFFNSRGKEIVLDLIQSIHENSAYLSEIDGAIGDGDHGINMNKGFTRTAEILTGHAFDFSGALNALGDILLSEIGGAMGPLYGTFFIEMGATCKNQDPIDKTLFEKMLKAGLDGVQSLGGAKVGDKTLLDTLQPAWSAFSQAVVQGEDFSTSLQQMAEAAYKGKESTRELVARLGRASRLGERSRGVLDAGATSCYLIINSLSISIQRLINE